MQINAVQIDAAPIFKTAFRARSHRAARSENDGTQVVKKSGANRFGIGKVSENSSDDCLQAGQAGRTAGFQSRGRLALPSNFN